MDAEIMRKSELVKTDAAAFDVTEDFVWRSPEHLAKSMFEGSKVTKIAKFTSADPPISAIATRIEVEAVVIAIGSSIGRLGGSEIT